MDKIYKKLKEAGYTKNEIKYISELNLFLGYFNEIFKPELLLRFEYNHRQMLIGYLMEELCYADEMFFVRHDGVRDTHKYTSFFGNRRVSDFDTLLEALLCTMICYQSGEYKEWT